MKATFTAIAPATGGTGSSTATAIPSLPSLHRPASDVDTITPGRKGKGADKIEPMITGCNL